MSVTRCHISCWCPDLPNEFSWLEWKSWAIPSMKEKWCVPSWLKRKCVFAWALHKNAWRWIQNPPFHRWCWVLEPQISDCLHYWSIPGIPCMKTWTWMFCSVFGGLILRCFGPHFLPSNQWLKNESKKKTYILHHILHHFASVSGLKMFETVHFSSSHMGFVQRLKALQFKNPCNSPWSDSAHSCIGRSPTGTFVDLSGNSGRQVLAFCEVGIIVQPNCMHSLGILGMGVAAAAARRISNFRFVLSNISNGKNGGHFSRVPSALKCQDVPRH